MFTLWESYSTSYLQGDVPFNWTINPFRGCAHGCIYCFARPYHEYLGFSAGLDFETRILVKERAPELLRKELSARRWVPQVIALSGAAPADPNKSTKKPTTKEEDATGS